MSRDQALRRSLTTPDAVVIGLGSMIGAGVFAAFAPAAASAGSAVLVSLAIAALVAFCNATSTAQLAAAYPTSGGTYVYGRERLGEWAGFLAGWGFVIGKTASCAAMAMTFAAYVAPPGWRKPAAVAAVVTLVAVNYRGITRTAQATRVIVTVVLSCLAVVLVSSWLTDGRYPIFDAAPLSTPTGVHGVLQGAGLLFFVFAGYARVATLGEEVRDPARTIPRAIVGALGLTVVVYALVASAALTTLGTSRLTTSSAPLADVVALGPWPGWAGPVVTLGGGAAALGALLALIAGIGRTMLAMAREGDLPRPLAAVHPRFAVPHRAELAVGVVVCLLVLVADLRGAIGFSSFGVLLYYLVANVAAFTQEGTARRYPRFLQVLGAVACVTLVFTLPATSTLAGLVVFAVGVGYRLFVRRAPTAGGARP